MGLDLASAFELPRTHACLAGPRRARSSRGPGRRRPVCRQDDLHVVVPLVAAPTGAWTRPVRDESPLGSARGRPGMGNEHARREPAPRAPQRDARTGFRVQRRGARCPALAAWTTFLLARPLTKSAPASLLAGLMFGFPPYLMGQSSSHLNLTLVFLVPLLGWLAVVFVQEGMSSRRYIVAAAVALVVQFSFSTEIAATLTLVAAVVFALAFLQAAGASEAAAGATRVHGARLRNHRHPRPALPAARFRRRHDGTCAWGHSSLCRPRQRRRADEGHLVAAARQRHRHPALREQRCRARSLPRHPASSDPPGPAHDARTEAPRALGFYCSPLPVHAPGARTTDARRRPQDHNRRLGLARATARAPRRTTNQARHVHRTVRRTLDGSLALAAEPVSRRALRVGVLAVIVLRPSPSGARWSSSVPQSTFFRTGAYSSYLHPGETALVLPYGGAGWSMLWQAETHFRFSMIGGWVGRSITKPECRWYWSYRAVAGVPPPDNGAAFRRFLLDHHVRAEVEGPGTGPWDRRLLASALDGVRARRVADATVLRIRRISRPRSRRTHRRCGRPHIRRRHPRGCPAPCRHTPRPDERCLASSHAMPKVG
jgi:hypothetical protein